MPDSKNGQSDHDPSHDYVADLHGRAPLPADAVLARAGLFSEDEHWGPGDPSFVRETGVTFGIPLVHAVSPAAAAPPHGRGRTVEVVFAFDLDELGGSQRYTAARFAVALADERVVARRVRPEPPEDAMRSATWVALRPTRERLAVRVTGLHTNRFACAFRDPGGRTLAGRSYLVGALLDVPAEVRELTGTLGLQAEVSRTVFEITTRFAAATRGAETEFRVPLGNGPGGGAAVRLCLAVDVERYSRHRLDAAERTQGRLIAVVDEALAHAGVDAADVSAQEQGDGRFLVFPPGIDESQVIPALVAGIRGALRRANRDLGEHARIRLRVGFHRGLVKPGPNGYVGDASIAVHRIIDCQALRDALKDTADADFAMIVPDVLYRDVIAQGIDGLNPRRFERVTATLEAKGFTEDCWIHLPAD